MKREIKEIKVRKESLALPVKTVKKELPAQRDHLEQMVNLGRKERRVMLDPKDPSARWARLDLKDHKVNAVKLVLLDLLDS